jgi:long-subunit acyl-CoA synthetase (AMP-forming)
LIDDKNNKELYMPVDAARQTLLHRLYYWAEKTPDNIYLTQPFPDGRVEDVTWKQAADQVSRMAGHLNTLNLPERCNIAILGKNSAHWILADLAIWAAGHISVPLYPTLNGETAAYVLAHSEARLMFLGKMDGTADGWNDIKEVIPDSLPVISLPMSPMTDRPTWQEIMVTQEPAAPRLPQLDDLATMIYTSGSTGQPKGVMHSFRAMASVADGLKKMFSASEDDRMLSYLPLAHVAERAAVETQSLYYGFRVYFANTLETFQQDLQRARPTFFFSVPRLWMKFYLGVNARLPLPKQQRLFRVPVVRTLVKKKILRQLGLDHCKTALTGAAPLSSEIIDWYRNLGLELLEVYGMTENFGYSHINRPGLVKVGTVGKPNPGVEHRITESGEVEVKSPGQMQCYYKNDEKTREDTTGDGFIKTGDMGEIDSEGYLRITGRVKDLFKTAKGKYVVPVPIENRFNHPAAEVICVAGANQVQPFVMVLLSDDARRELSQEDKRRVLEQELIAELEAVNVGCESHEKLAFAVLVRELWTMENGMLTPTMKIKRNVIEAFYAGKMEGWFGQNRKVVWEL